MISSRPAATEGKASGGGERARHRGLFGATKNLAILLVAVSSSVLIHFSCDVSFCSCVIVGAPWACETRVANAHLGGNGAPVEVAPRACTILRKEAAREEEPPRTPKEESAMVPLHYPCCGQEVKPWPPLAEGVIPRRREE